MKPFIFSAALLIFFAACQSLSSNNTNTTDSVSTKSADTGSGWISLSGGDSIKGWHSYGKSVPGKAWNMDSGSIHLQAGVKSGYQTSQGGDLVTNDSFSNFHLRLEWKIGKKANSGIIFYVKEDTSKYKETWNTGMEMQVCDKDSNEDAHSPKHEAGELYDLISASTRAAKGYGEWNKVEIISDKGKLSLYLNGVNIINTTLWDDQWKKLIANSKFKDMPGFGTFTTGRIALQDHGEEVWYRNIMIKKL